MAGRIRDADVATVRETARLDDIVREHLQLRPAGGGRLKGLCPFHEEKTPSFSVSPEQGFYHCFGCGAGGDVFSFVQEIEHVGFAEAVERLARRAGVTLTYEGGGAAAHGGSSLRARLVAAHQAAAEFYIEQLATPAGRGAREFLTSRGFDEAVWSTYGVGFAPTGWEALVGHLTGRGFSRDELITGGLARTSTRGGVIDAFRGRLTWPIRDSGGEVIGFGARQLDETDQGPKYLNTGETPLYRKGQVLYGVDLARKEIARRRQAVIVEGYTDVMACHLAGVPTAVATCGTAFGAEHIKVLRRLLMDQDELRGEVVFLFDGDAAGQQAAVRAFADDQRFVTQTFVAVEPAGLDPCDLRLAHGDAAVRDLVARRVPLVEFVIRSSLTEFDLEIPEGRVRGLAAAVPLVARIKDQSLRDEYARRLSGWVGTETSDDVVRRVRAAAGTDARPAARSGQRPSRPRPQPGAQTGPERHVEREVLKVAVQQPTLAGADFDALGGELFADPGHLAVRQTIEKAGGALAGATDPNRWVARLRDASPDDDVRRLVTALAVEPAKNAGGLDARYARTQIAAVQVFGATRRSQELKGRIQRLNPLEHPADYNRLFGELVALEQHIRELREQSLGDP